MRDAACGFRGLSGRPPRAVTVLAALHLAALVLPAPGCATELSASDRKIAEAGREGRALLRDVQREQAAAPGSARAPSAAIERQAARMRSGLKREAGRRPGPASRQDGVALSRGICVGCLK